MTVYGALVERHGLAASHALLLDAVPTGARVLDVGCAEGFLAERLRAEGCRVLGLERDGQAASRARRVADEVVEGDVEDGDVREAALRAVPETFWTGGANESPFDVVLFGDVLEHLRDPAAVLQWAATVAPRAVVSLPNIGHWTARREVVRGRFPQAEHGLFDRTHLHFYTRDTARALVERSGWRVTGERFSDAPLPLESRLPALGRLRARALSRRPELFALQVVLTCEAA